MKANDTFGERLKAVLRDGNLRVADLARWFDAPHPTVRGWLVDGWDPGGAPMDRAHIYRMLGILESRVRQKRGFPLPRLSPKERIYRLMVIRNAALRTNA